MPVFFCNRGPPVSTMLPSGENFAARTSPDRKRECRDGASCGISIGYKVGSVQNPFLIPFNPGWVRTGFPVLGLLLSPIHWVV